MFCVGRKMQNINFLKSSRWACDNICCVSSFANVYSMQRSRRNHHFFFTEKPKIIDNFTRHPALYLGTACERELPMVFSKVVLCALFSSKFDFLITLAKIKCIEY